MAGKRLPVRALLLLAVWLPLAACRPSGPAAQAPESARAAPAAAAPAVDQAMAPAAAPAPVPVHLAGVGTFTGAPLYLARQRGYFTAEGLDVDTINFKVSADVIPALATGEVDAAGLALNPALFNAVARGIKLTLVADLASNQRGRATSALVIRKEVMDAGRYTRPEDLRGMTIGVPGPFTNVHYYLALIAERHGFPLEEINVTPVAMADSLLALRNGSLDGYFDIEPSPTIAAREGFGVRVIEADELYEGFQSSVVAYGPSMTERPDVATRFMVGYVRGLRDYLDAFFEGKDRDRAVADIIREGIALPQEIVAPGINPSGHLTLASMEDILNWWVKMGALTQKPDVRAMVDEQYLDQAQQRVGAR
jgi:NitT/TauT family transport system substrate-binding protein